MAWNLVKLVRRPKGVLAFVSYFMSLFIDCISFNTKGMPKQLKLVLLGPIVQLEMQ